MPPSKFQTHAESRAHGDSQAHEHSTRNEFNHADVGRYMQLMGQEARHAATLLRRQDTATKNAALQAIARHLEASRQDLLDANRADLQRGEEVGLEAALLDRLALDDSRIDAMIEGLSQVAGLPDPSIDSTAAMVAAADHALYEGKRAGRNRVVVHQAPR